MKEQIYVRLKEIWNLPKGTEKAEAFRGLGEEANVRGAAIKRSTPSAFDTALTRSNSSASARSGTATFQPWVDNFAAELKPAAPSPAPVVEPIKPVAPAVTPAPAASSM